MERKKTFNNSLHNVSKKRLEAIKNGTWKPKPRTALRKASPKAISLWNKARQECFDRWGKMCFLCHATDCEIHVHHFRYTRQQRPDLKYDVDNLIPLCAYCHNHSGADKRFYELQKEILSRIE